MVQVSKRLGKAVRDAYIDAGAGKGGDQMERYEVRQISPLTWGIYDKVEDEYVLETTRKGIELYADMMGLEV